jgi:hypothetical protein
MKPSIKLFHWLPRIICILAILVVSLFAADAFESGHTIWQQLSSFFMHLIPSFILLAFLLVAWKWEFIGGIIFTAIGIVMSPVIFLHNYNVNHLSIAECIRVILMITFPFIVVGILFIISYLKKKKHFSQTNTA